MKWFIPKCVAVLTRHPRELVRAGVDFEWSSTLWVHNLFRAYELVFGRRSGVRREMAANAEGVVQFFTWEAALSYLEGYLRTFRLPKIVKVYLPVLAPINNLPVPASPYLFAIAFDTFASSATLGNDTGKTWSHTCTGSNTLMWVSNWENLTATTTSVTYAAAAFIQVDNLSETGMGNISMWYKVSPATGTNNVVTVGNPGVNNGGVSASYSGCLGTDIATNTYTKTGSTSTSDLVGTVTTTATNSWTIMASGSSGNQGAGANTHLVSYGAGNTNAQVAIYDSNGALATGSHSLEMLNSGGAAPAAIIVDFFAPTASPQVNSNFLFFMGQ